MEESTRKRSLKTIERMIRVIDTLQRCGSCGVTDIANELDISPATAHNYLSTLEQNEFVVKKDSKYRLGLRFLNVGGYVRDQFDVLPLAESKVKQIAEDTDERAQFLVEEHGQAVVICKETSSNAVVADTAVGKTSYLHASAAGKAILSKTADDRIDAIIDRWGLPELTENTIVNRDELFQELSKIREQGYAYNNEESIVGLRSVGVPVVTSDGDVLGGISVSGPANRMKGDWYRKEIPNLLLGAANEIELKSTYG
jgi:DNA-binding IclR family transcriptional regulator